MPPGASRSSTGIPVASVARLPGPRVLPRMRSAIGVSASMAAATDRPRVCGAIATPARSALALDGQMLDVLVGERLDDEREDELAPRDELRRGRRGRDAVVVLAGDRLVEPLDDNEARWDHVDVLAGREAERLHLAAAHRADALVGRHEVGLLDARQVRWRARATRVAALAAGLRLLLHRGRGRRRDRGDLRAECERQLPLERLESLRRRPLALRVREATAQLQVQVSHPHDESQDRLHENGEAPRRDRPLEPLPQHDHVGHLRRRRSGGRRHLAA